MTMMRFAPVFGLAFVVAACGPGDRTDTAVTRGDTMPGTTVAGPQGTGIGMDTGMAGAPGMAGMENRVQLNPVNNSGISGEAMLNPTGNQVQVMVRLMGTPGNTTHQGHIHSGRCPNPGGVVAPLQPITTGADGAGEMTTTVDVPAAAAMDGQHVVQYHTAGGSPGQPVACGDIPQGTGM